MWDGQKSDMNDVLKLGRSSEEKRSAGQVFTVASWVLLATTASEGNCAVVGSELQVRLASSVERVKGFRISVGDQSVHHLQDPRRMRRHGMSRHVVRRRILQLEN